MRTLPRWCIGAALVCAASSRAVGQDGTAPVATTKSTLQGVYTDVQADRGKTLHETACTSCHNTDAYSGSAFQTSWIGRTLYDFFDLVRTTMPNDNPGSLSRQQYADVVAYVLKLNGFPAGAADVPSGDDSLKVIKIEGKAGATR
jgi:S-disulfanyl-L-cysteine oxidoreductase SoxD